jgi:Coenzyme PQQ synthesis protein D (PqqD)
VNTEPPVLEAVLERSDRVVGRQIAGETILVPLVGHGAELDSIFNLNAVGAFIWEQIDGARDGHAIVAALVAAFDVTAARAAADYVRFVEQLESVGAVRRKAG